MYEFFNIGEIADLLQIPKSTLRYWDREGLIKLSRNYNNDYREYSFKAVIDVVSIMYYRSLNVPISELKKLSSMTIDDLEDVLAKTDDKLNAQMAELVQIQKRVKDKRKALLKIRGYMETPYVMDQFDFDCVVDFNRDNNRHLMECLNESEKFVIAITNEGYFHGVTKSAPLSDEKVVWRNGGHKCLKCLLKFYPDHPNDNITEALGNVYAYLKDNGYRYKAVISRLLISEFGDNPANYYEVCVELE